MQAAQAANRICFAITLPKSKCDVSPKHGLSLPNLSAEFGHNGPEFGPDSSKLARQQREPNAEPFDCRNSRFRRDSVIPNRGLTGATKPFRRTREVFRKHWLPTFWCM
jgi:hypothetical protein